MGEETAQPLTFANVKTGLPRRIARILLARMTAVTTENALPRTLASAMAVGAGKRVLKLIALMSTTVTITGTALSRMSVLATTDGEVFDVERPSVTKSASALPVVAVLHHKYVLATLVLGAITASSEQQPPIAFLSTKLPTQ
jgi:hypothetical protein